MNAPEYASVGRLALRVEGEFWSAYYAMADSMDGAILLATIRLRVVKENPERKAQFMGLAKEIVADIVQSAVGKRPVWLTPPVPAPEHERGGNA